MGAIPIGTVKKMAGGRPSVMTPELIGKLEEAFLLGCSDLEACLVADISKQTLYNYQEANPEFVDRKEKLKKNPTYLARRTVAKAVGEDSDLALKYLERKESAEFSTKTDIANTHSFLQMPSVKIDGKEHEFNVGEAVK